MRFIYSGECELEQHAIESFQVVAMDLKVVGLTSESDEDSTIPNKENLEKEPVGIIDTQITIKLKLWIMKN